MIARRRHARARRWVVTATTAERGLCWQIVLGADAREAAASARQRLRADHGVDLLSVTTAAEVGV